MPRKDPEEQFLRHHLLLAALKSGQGSAFGLGALLQMATIVGFIDEARPRKLDPDVLVTAKQVIGDAIHQGLQTGRWHLDEPAFEVCARLLSWFEDQLRAVPLYVVTRAIERLVQCQPVDRRQVVA